MTRKYIDFDLIKKHPNTYNLTPESIKKLKILDWKKLKKKTWHNDAMNDKGNWWCRLIGCQADGEKYNDFDEFWIGFNEDDNSISYNFYANEGMCKYTFDEFYAMKDIENVHDMMLQVNTIRWLNSMIDAKILGV